jgi:GxxExxY protein
MLVEDPLTYRIIGLAMEVHTQLGPGLLESAYEDCLAYDLHHAGIAFQRQAPIATTYKGAAIREAYRADLLIGDDVIAEIKSVQHLAPIHEAQILTYLKLSGRRFGLLFNFDTVSLKQGLRRFIV